MEVFYDELAEITQAQIDYVLTKFKPNSRILWMSTSAPARAAHEETEVKTIAAAALESLKRNAVSTREIVTDHIGGQWDPTISHGRRKLGHNPSWVKVSDVDAVLVDVSDIRTQVKKLLADICADGGEERFISDGYDAHEAIVDGVVAIIESL